MKQFTLMALGLALLGSGSVAMAADYDYAATLEVLTPSINPTPGAWMTGLMVRISNTGNKAITKITRRWESQDNTGAGNGWSHVFDPAIDPGCSVEVEMWNMMTPDWSDGTYNATIILNSADGNSFQNPVEERTGTFSFVLGNPPQLVDNFTVSGYSYKLTDSSRKAVELTAGPSGEVAVPSTVDYEGVTYIVTGIADEIYFDNSYVTSLTLGDNIERIGYRAFYYCDALGGTVKLPASLKELGENAFGDNEALEAFEVDPACANYCSIDGILYTKNKKTLLNAPGKVVHAVLPDEVETIARAAFFQCWDLEDVIIGNHLVTLGKNAFYKNNKLTSLDFPNTLQNLGEDCMYSCQNLTSISVAPGGQYLMSADNIIYNVDGTEMVKMAPGLIHCSILPTCKKVLDSAAYGCKWLVDLELPNSVEEIESYGFGYCASLEKLVIGTGMKTIASQNFSTETLLSVTCLAEVPPTLSASLNDNTYSLGVLYVPEGSIEAYTAAEGWNKFVNIEAYKAPAAEYEYAATVEVLTPTVKGIPDNWIEGLKVKITNTGKNPITQLYRRWDNLDKEGNGNGWGHNFDPAIQPGESVELDMWNMMCSALLDDGTYNCKFVIKRAENDVYTLENPEEERTGYFTLVVGDQPQGIVPPYFNNFTADDAIEGWTLIDGNGDDDLWTQEDGYLKAPYNDDIPMDDWIFTPAFSFEGGMAYPFSVDVRINKEVYAPEKMEIMYGTEPTVEGMTQQIMEPTEFSSNTWATYSYTLAPATTGLYYIGLHCITDPDKTQLHVTNFTVGAPSTTGVDAIIGSDTQAVYYDLIGRMVANPQPGNIYIRKAGNKATKVIL